MFGVLLALQLLVFENIKLGGYINPYIYILFILLLPFETPGWILLLLGFFTGLIMDSFYNTLGIHSSATLFMAFIRPYIISNLSTHEQTNATATPTMYQNGVEWFVKYSLLLVLAHHILLFYLEAFSFVNFFATMARVLLSTLVTFILILLSQFLFFKK